MNKWKSRSQIGVTVLPIEKLAWGTVKLQSVLLVPLRCENWSHLTTTAQYCMSKASLDSSAKHQRHVCSVQAQNVERYSEREERRGHNDSSHTLPS